LGNRQFAATMNMFQIVGMHPRGPFPKRNNLSAPIQIGAVQSLHMILHYSR
jgi:hypothetical protein